jgi:pilus assembly protein CpaD
MLAAASMLAAAVVAVGCDELRMSDERALVLNVAETAHPITFRDRLEELALEIPPHGLGLSQNQYADVYRFARRFRAESNGALTVSVPGSARLGWSYGSPLEDIRAALVEAEVPGAKVRKASHHRGRGGAVLKLTYIRPVAVPPECGDWHRNVAEERNRVPYPMWGCATQRNFAGMVANSRDLQRPQDEDPRSAERRSATWSKYIAPDAAPAGSGSTDPNAKAASSTKK